MKWIIALLFLTSLILAYLLYASTKKLISSNHDTCAAKDSLYEIKVKLNYEYLFKDHQEYFAKAVHYIELLKRRNPNKFVTPNDCNSSLSYAQTYFHRTPAAAKDGLAVIISNEDLANLIAYNDPGVDSTAAIFGYTDHQTIILFPVGQGHRRLATYPYQTNEIFPKVEDVKDSMSLVMYFNCQ
jgi:hypothetical protein